MANDVSWSCRMCILYGLKEETCKKYDEKHPPEDACDNWRGINEKGEVIDRWELKKHQHDVINDHAAQDVVRVERAAPDLSIPAVASRLVEPKVEVPKPAEVVKVPVVIGAKDFQMRLQW